VTSKLSLKDSPPNCLVLASSKWIAFAWKALAGAFLILPEGWCEAAQEAEMCDKSGVKVKKQARIRHGGSLQNHLIDLKKSIR
jgi:hypothetical protein